MGVLLGVLLAMVVTPAPQACLHPRDDPNQVTDMAPGPFQLVGVAAGSQKRGAQVVIRWGNASNQSRVYRVGDKLDGRMEVLLIGVNSTLLREKGRFFILKLNGRTTRDWRSQLQRLPPCS